MTPTPGGCFASRLEVHGGCQQELAVIFGRTASGWNPLLGYALMLLQHINSVFCQKPDLAFSFPCCQDTILLSFALISRSAAPLTHLLASLTSHAGRADLQHLQ